MTLVSGLHRRRLHRRLRSRQHADASGPAHGADHRRAVGRSRAARGRCGGGLAEEPLDRGGSCGDAFARRRKMAARPRRRPRAVQDLLDLRFHRRRQYRPGDGCAARRFRRRDRAGDAGLSGNRPHRLSGQSVRRLRAAERKPAEGSSAQPDARFQSGAGAGAPEPDQGRARRSRDAGARRGCRSRASRRSRRQGLWRRHHRCRVRPRSGNHRRASRWIIACRSAPPASGSVLPGRWSPPARSNRMRRARSADAPVGGPAACLAGSCSQATLQQIANAEKAMPVLHLDPDQVVAGQGRGAAGAGLGQRSNQRRPDPDREQFDAGSGRSSAISSWPRCSRTCHRAGDGRYRRRPGAVGRAATGGRRW